MTKEQLMAKAEELRASQERYDTPDGEMWDVAESDYPKYDEFVELLEESYANGEINAREFNDISEICLWDWDYKTSSKDELATWAESISYDMVDFVVALNNSLENERISAEEYDKLGQKVRSGLYDFNSDVSEMN